MYFRHLVPLALCVVSLQISVHHWNKEKKSKRHDIRHWKHSVIHLWIQVRTRGTPFPSLLILRSLSLDHCHFITNPGCATDLCIQSSVSTSRKRSCGKVMFLHLSVILFTGGEGVSVCSVWCHFLSDRDPPPGQRPPWTETPLYCKERAVLILLYCILIQTEDIFF